jgi:hypothetical protein
MDTTGMMNLSWADILPKGNGYDERTNRDESRPRPRTKPIKKDPEPRHVMEPALVGDIVDIGRMSLHLGCGPYEAVRRVKTLGWPTWVERRLLSHKHKRWVDVRVWEVQP